VIWATADDGPWYAQRGRALAKDALGSEFVIALELSDSAPVIVFRSDAPPAREQAAWSAHALLNSHELARARIEALKKSGAKFFWSADPPAS